MNQRLETSNVVENFENLEAQKSIEQIESNEVIQEIQSITNFEVEETQASVEAREISTKEIWGEIAGLTIKGQSKRIEVTIQNLLNLSAYDYKKGRIEETRKPLKYYLNEVFENEGISIELKYYSAKELFEEARAAIEQLATEGKLGTKVQIEVEKKIKTTEEVWGEIAGLTIKGQSKRIEVTIQNLLNLSAYDYKKGRIEETRKPLRDYLNEIFENEAIGIELKYKSPKELIEKAKEAIVWLATEGKLGIEAQNEIESQNEIKKTEEVWGEIAGKILNGHKNTKVTIPNLLNLSISDIRNGKILETKKPLRDYLNKIFEIEGVDIEIKWRSPKELIEEAREAIEQLANQGKLTDTEPSEPSIPRETTEEVWGKIAGKTIIGRRKKPTKVTIPNLLELADLDIKNGKIKETDEKLRDYLNEIFENETIGIELKYNSSKELIEEAKEAIWQLANQGKLIDTEPSEPSEPTEEVWGEIAGKTLVGTRQKDTKIKIKNLLNLSDHDIKNGKIKETDEKLRKYLNKIFEIEGVDIEMNTQSSKELIEKAKAAIRKLATEGKLGIEEKNEIEAKETTEQIWGEIADKTIIAGRQKTTKVTIQKLVKLSKSNIKHGIIEETGKPLREYLNQIFENEAISIELKYNSSKELIEEARAAIKDLVLKGSFGELEKKEYIKYEIQEKQEKIQKLILEKINSIASKPTNENRVEFDSMEEYVIGEILEKYVINKEGEPFRLETNKTFQVEIETDNHGKNPKLDFLISTEFTKKDWESIVIEWHPFRLDWVMKKLQEKIAKEKDQEKIAAKISKLKQDDNQEIIQEIKKGYEDERQKLAEKLNNNEITIVISFQNQNDREDLYKILRDFTITNSNFPETQEEFTTEFNNIYIQILKVQEKKKQRIARIKIEEYLEENNANSIEALTEEQITKLWKKRFTFLGNQNTISERIKNSKTHTKKTNQETQIQYKRRNLIAFYNYDEYKLKDKELEENINQKIEAIRHEITDLEAILKPEHETAEIIETKTIEEQVTVDIQEQELLEPVEIYQEFKLTSY